MDKGLVIKYNNKYATNGLCNEIMWKSSGHIWQTKVHVKHHIMNVLRHCNNEKFKKNKIATARLDNYLQATVCVINGDKEREIFKVKDILLGMCETVIKQYNSYFNYNLSRSQKIWRKTNIEYYTSMIDYINLKTLLVCYYDI